MKLLIFLVSIFIIAQAYQDKIHLKDLKVLTFHKGRYTTGRRSAPVIQLKRVGGDAQTSYEPDTVQCKNVGFDGMSVQWKCEADMDEKYRFGKVEVVCEGYNFAGDQNVLVGSCGLEYSLELTSKGKTHQRKQSKSNQNRKDRHNHHRHHHGNHEYVDTSSSAGSIFVFVFFLLAFVIVFIFCCMPNSTTRSIPATSIGGAPPPTTSYTTSNIYPTSQPIHTSHTTIIDNSGPGYVDGFIDGSTLSNRRGYYNTDTYSTSSSYYNETSAPAYESDDSGDDDDSTTRVATGFGGTRTR